MIAVRTESSRTLSVRYCSQNRYGSWVKPQRSLLAMTTQPAPRPSTSAVAQRGLDLRGVSSRASPRASGIAAAASPVIGGTPRASVEACR